ncbi:hypothetical protein [Pediococcus inopinatus]|uniref:hypothetical protein n=1 Tax=Pediococcus inopinatus TaxID=114090 RepID=UPI0007C4C8B7|nr:hypothetical protein [Pediococcus inopinatus]
MQVNLALTVKGNNMRYLSLAYISYFFLKFSGYTTLNVTVPSSFLRILVLFFLMCTLLTDGQASTRYRLMFSAVILAFCVLTLRAKILNDLSMMDSDFIFFLLFLMASTTYEKIVRIVRISFWMNLVGVIFLMVLVFLHRISNYVTINTDLSVRKAWGFRSPNGLGCSIAFICINYIFLNRNKKGLIGRLIITLVINYVTYTQTKSRTSFISYIVFCILMCFIGVKKEKIPIFTRYSLNVLIWILPFAAVIFPYLYKDSKFWIILNRVLSYRLIMGHQYYEIFGIHLFGSMASDTIPYNWGNWIQTFLIDSTYVRLLLEFGLIAFVFILGYVFIMTKRLLNSEFPVLITFVFIGIMYGVTERLAYHVDVFPLILLLNPVYLGQLKKINGEFFNEK